MLWRSLCLRPALAHPLRTTLTLLGVAVGVAAVISTLLASRAAVASLGRDVDELSGGAELEITRPGGVEATDLAAVRALCAEALLVPVIEDRALVPRLDDLVRVLGVDLLLAGGAGALELDVEPTAHERAAEGRDARAGEARDTHATANALEAARDAMLFGDGIALSVRLARELGVGVGDSVELVIGAKPVALPIVATLPESAGLGRLARLVLMDVALAQELLGRTGRYDRVEFWSRSPASTQTGAFGPSANGDASGTSPGGRSTGTRPGDDRASDSRAAGARRTNAPRLPPAARDSLAARARALLPDGYRVEPPSSRREEGERMVRALEFNLTALSGVTLLVGIVLVATSLATAVVQRRDLIALARSLGASRAQLARTLLAEAALIGLGGGALGLGLGLVGARGAIGGVRSTAATISSSALAGDVHLEPAFAIAAVLLGLGAALVAALLPLREALRTPPIQGLRGEHPESVTGRHWRGRALVFAGLLALAALFVNLPPLEDRPVWALLAALAILSTLLVAAGPLVDLCAGVGLGWLPLRLATPLRLAQAGLEASRGRSAWAAGAVGVAVGLAVSMTIMVGSFRQSVVEWTRQAMPSDLFLRPLTTAGGGQAGAIAPEVEAHARAVFGADAVDAFHQQKAYVDGQAIRLGGADFAVVAREGGVPFLDGRPSTEVFGLALERGRVVVNEPFARRFDRWRGDTIRLETAGGPLEKEIEGVYRDYSGHTGRVVMERTDFLALYPDEGARNIAIYLSAGETVESARARLRDALGGRYAVELLDNRELRAEILHVFERTFAVTIALQIIAAGVAAIAVVAVLSALIHERRRELAVVRVLGGSRRQLLGLVLSEAFFLGLAGTLGGLAVGALVGWVLVAVVNLQSFGWTLEYRTPASLWWTLLAVLPACLAAGIAPALYSLRAAPREALHATN